VCVIGATSRPDLLDAALLRPGRLDRLLHCGLPRLAERVQIMEAAARRLALDPSVNLAVVAGKASGFTGVSVRKGPLSFQDGICLRIDACGPDTLPDILLCNGKWL
jgi:ATP-dependent 26S proteasome regulatory subunit